MGGNVQAGYDRLKGIDTDLRGPEPTKVPTVKDLASELEVAVEKINSLSRRLADEDLKVTIEVSGVEDENIFRNYPKVSATVVREIL